MSHICLVLACLTLPILAKRIHEPACSRFDYDEKMLAKLVRVEHRMELLEEKLRDKEAAIASKLDALEVASMKTEASLSDVEQQATVGHTEIGHLQLTVEALRRVVQGLEPNVPVGFMAQISSDVVNPNKGDIIVFDDVITNVGNAYDASQGTFTAPRHGVYNFNVVTSAADESNFHALHLYIMKDGTQVGYVFLDQNRDYWLRRSTDITLELTTWERVWVEVGKADNPNRLGGCCFHNHFSGFLIDKIVH